MSLNLNVLIPELTALGLLLVMLGIEIFKGEKPSSASRFLSFAGGAALLVILAVFFGKKLDAFGGVFQMNAYSGFFKILFTFTVIVVLLITGKFFERRKDKTTEFYLVLWTCLMGMFFLVSANDFLLLFIALEIMTLSFYIMAAYLKQSLFSIEAGLKYLILGSLASAFLIFGIALLYTASGTTTLPGVQTFFLTHGSDKIMILGILLIVSGLGFKIASAPFQLWVPDVYEGSPTPVVAFLSVGSKAAGIAVLMKILFQVFPGFGHERSFLFSILALLTLLYGNFAALLQTNIKRLFGYSSIGHAGYLLVGIAAGTIAGVSAVLYYLIAYAVTNLAAFWVINAVEAETGSSEIKAFRGLAKKSPFLAGSLFVALLSLAGVPPLAGFFGKFLILLAAIQNGLGWLALAGALMVAVALYYYLSIVRTMYLETPEEDKTISVTLSSKIILGVLVAGILVVGIFQSPFYHFALEAARALGL